MAITPDSKVSIAFMALIIGALVFYFTLTPTIEYVDKTIQKVSEESKERSEMLRQDLIYIRNKLDRIDRTLIDKNNK